VCPHTATATATGTRTTTTLARAVTRLHFSQLPPNKKTNAVTERQVSAHALCVYTQLYASAYVSIRQHTSAYVSIQTCFNTRKHKCIIGCMHPRSPSYTHTQASSVRDLKLVVYEVLSYILCPHTATAKATAAASSLSSLHTHRTPSAQYLSITLSSFSLGPGLL